MFLLFVYFFSPFFTQISKLSQSLLLYDFADEHRLCTKCDIDVGNHKHTAWFRIHCQLKTEKSIQCAVRIQLYPSLVSNVCGRVLATDSIQFVYTDTQAHIDRLRYHSLTQALFSAYSSVYSRVYAILHTQTHATVATATVFIYYYNTSSSAKLLLKRE